MIYFDVDHYSSVIPVSLSILVNYPFILCAPLQNNVIINCC
ncbi:hypothetical protein BN136_1918 [Cronobacter universalis NCTC 9529]|nr:hypothetical protein BN136_1918 [Cronobacter universalis NCTC 9529]